MKIPPTREMRFTGVRTKARGSLKGCFCQRQPRRCMVEAIEIKRVMSEGEVVIRIEKRWIARHRLIQQIDCLEVIRRPACRQKNIFGSRVEIEGGEIARRPPLNRQFFSSRDFGAKLLSDFLRNLTLDGEQIVQIAIVLFGPDV